MNTAGNTQDVHAAGLDLHDEEDVQPLEEHGVNVQEVARQDPGCRGGQELAPGWSVTSGVARV